MVFKYKKGDIIEYKNSLISERNEKFIIRNCYYEKNGHPYYTLDLINSDLITQCFESNFLEDITKLSKYFSRKKKLERLKGI